MTGEQKKQVRALCDRIFERGQYGVRGSADFDEKVDDFLNELEKIWPKTGRLLRPDEHTVISVDPLGADRAARTIRFE